MPFDLRYYQEEAVNSIPDYFMSNSGNPIIALPTGTGKSIVIAELAKRILTTYPDQRIQMVTHVKTLIQQNFDKLLEQWPTAPAGIHSAGLNRRDCLQPVIFGGIQSMYRRAKDFGHVDILLVDECHLIPPNSETMYGKYIAELTKVNPFLKVIGLSATPYRLKGGHLTTEGIFTDVCCDYTQRDRFNKLIDEGYLCPVVPKQTRTVIDDEGLHTRAGEFIPAEVAERVAGDVTYQAVKEMLSEGADRQHWIIFCVSIEHVEDVVDILIELGVEAVPYHSKMKAVDSDRALADFAVGKVRVIVGRDRLTTGVDLPEVDFIGMLRLTRSPGLWVQMLGRGTRPYPGKENCLVLDFAGNTKRLGPINDPIMPNATRKSGGGGQAPVKACPCCLVFQPAGAKLCSYCGFEFPRFMKLEPTASTAVLIKREDLPPVDLAVTHITYQRHKKKGRPDSMCVTYFGGLTQVREFVCPDHSGYASRKAKQWWQKRSAADYPETLEELLSSISTLPTPTRMHVDTDGKYPNLVGVVF